jgi:hypothetical protein
MLVMSTITGATGSVPAVTNTENTNSGNSGQTLTEALNNFMISTVMMQIASDQNGPFNPANEAINEAYAE